jgi:hypothetical protein
MTPLVVIVKMDLNFESKLSDQQVDKITAAIVEDTASDKIPPSYISVTMVLQGPGGGPGSRPASRHLLTVVYETSITITIPGSEAETAEGQASIEAAAAVEENVAAMQASIVAIPVLAEVNGGVVPTGSETYTPTSSPTTATPRYHSLTVQSSFPCHACFSSRLILANLPLAQVPVQYPQRCPRRYQRQLQGSIAFVPGLFHSIHPPFSLLLELAFSCLYCLCPLATRPVQHPQQFRQPAPRYIPQHLPATPMLLFVTYDVSTETRAMRRAGTASCGSETMNL